MNTLTAPSFTRPLVRALLVAAWAAVAALTIATAPVSAADGDTIGGSLSAAPGYVSATSMGNVPAVATFDSQCGSITPDTFLLEPGQTATPTSTAYRGWVSVTFRLPDGSGGSASLVIDLTSAFGLDSFRNDRLACKVPR